MFNRKAAASSAAAFFLLEMNPTQVSVPTEKLALAQQLYNVIESRVTGGVDYPDHYRELRKAAIKDTVIEPMLPAFVKNCFELEHIWQFIKTNVTGYVPRREYLREAFAPIIYRLERVNGAPLDDLVTEGIENFNEDYVTEAWNKALERRKSDPEGAITTARTLLEVVFKHILGKLQIEFDDSEDLPKLYKQVALGLNLSPDQHTEQIFRQILTGARSTIEGIGALRNKHGDAHGKAMGKFKPAARHAEFAVNMSGAVALFLLRTYTENYQQD